MSNYAVGIKDLLVTGSVGAFGGAADWAIYIGAMPDKPDAAIGIFNTGGSAPNPQWLIDFPSIQVRIRGNEGSYEDAYTKCIAIKSILLGLPSQDINGDRWVSVSGIGDITELGRDQNKRPEFSVNFALIIEPATGAHRDPLGGPAFPVFESGSGQIQLESGFGNIRFE